MDSDIVGSILLQVVLIAVNAVFDLRGDRCGLPVTTLNWKKWHRRETRKRQSCSV